MKGKKPRRLVCGVGINDADYQIYKRNPYWTCPYYSKWRAMLSRCYNAKTQKRQKTYQGTVVCDHWLVFSHFRKWMIDQNWEGNALDKDFLQEDTKIYSPDTCIFIPISLNNFLTLKGSARSGTPLGTSYHQKKGLYQARCNDGKGNNIWCGEFSDSHLAHNEWIKAKIMVAKNYYQQYEDPRIRKGLNRIISKLEYHLENNLEVKSL